MESPTKDISKFQDKDGLLLEFNDRQAKKSNYPQSFENSQLIRNHETQLENLLQEVDRMIKPDEN